MKYDYETVSKNGAKYGYIISESKHVTVYVNDKEWGSPQGERFIVALIDDIKRIKK